MGLNPYMDILSTGSTEVSVIVKWKHAQAGPNLLDFSKSYILVILLKLAQDIPLNVIYSLYYTEHPKKNPLYIARKY